MTLNTSKDDVAVQYLESLPAKLKDYGNSYFRHLKSGTTQPQRPLDDDVSDTEIQQVRLRLVGLVG